MNTPRLPYDILKLFFMNFLSFSCDIVKLVVVNFLSFSLDVLEFFF